MELMQFADICDAILDMQRDLKRVIVAIDGMAGAGKTTLANALKAAFPKTDIIHMDDFYLPKALRNAERMAEPGGHMDTERFAEEVAMPIWKGLVPRYRVFDCTSQSFTEAVACTADAELCVVEGTYSTHPSIPDVYDLRIFVQTDDTVCMERIRARAQSEWEIEMFEKEWIPAERLYFDSYMTKELSEMIYDGGRDEDFSWTPPAFDSEDLLPYIGE